MKRTAGVLALALALVATGCSNGGGGEDSAPSSTASTATTTSTTSGPAVKCDGLGAAPASGQGEVTWVADGKLWAAAPTAGATPRCLREVDSAVTTLQWGGAGDRVLLGTSVVLADSRVVDAFTSSGNTLLSRPKGTSVIQATGGRLRKHELDKGERDLSFMDRHEDAVYHPAGTHVVSWGDNVGTPRLVIANNNGGDARDVVTNESGVKAFSGVAFTASGALLYVADHGDHVDMHRLVIGEETFSTVVSIKAPGTLRDVTTSLFEGGGVAWTAGDCTSEVGMGLVAQRDGKYFEGLKGTPAERARPVGWLPDRSLVAIENGACNPDAAGRIVVIRDAGAKVDVLPGKASVVAVRAALPPPPAPPKDIPQQAPA